MSSSSRAILTTAQSRLTLHVVLITVSAVAVASSVSKAGSGGTMMLSGSPGDIRGVNSVLGGAGMALACVARIALLSAPLSWRSLIDRLEFGLVTVLWICWTSATMAFSAFTIDRGICDWASYPVPLPTCSILTFDLVLVHLASLTTLTLLLVILSCALQPLSAVDMHATVTGIGKDDVWVMWDLALQDGEDLVEGSTRASTTTTTTYGTQSSVGTTANMTLPVKVDKFESGKTRTYASLVACSLVTFVTALTAAMIGGEQVPSAYLLEIVAGLSLLFAAFNLVSRKKGADTLARRRRVLEVALGSLFFLLWPTITYTLLPALSNRPCAQPSAPETDESPQSVLTLCSLSATAIASAWLASWLLFARLLGLVFPMPAGLGVVKEGERAPLLHGSGGRADRAGREFELGDDEDEVVLLVR